MLYFGWLKGSAIHVSKALEKDSASRSAGKGETDFVTLIINRTDKEIIILIPQKTGAITAPVFIFSSRNSDIIIIGTYIYTL